MSGFTCHCHQPPQHIAVIMDGNGRWAESKGLNRSKGHEQGVKTLRDFIRNSVDLGIKHLTVYAFSSENWNRPPSEVKSLMKLLERYLKEEEKNLAKNNVRYRFIGDLSRLDKNILHQITKIETTTRDKDGICLDIALSYGGYDELIHVAKSLAIKVAGKELSLSDITKETFEQELYTYPYPHPDLLIRTGGEQRISNFLLWQLAYTEMIFLDVLWPDFAKTDLEKAIQEFQNRQRRFGKL